ncbi:TRZ/ATZ family hydrolase [Oceanobacter mangrovi]|uniref:TRZ/ATZ family hydrolase n=1 Tax=Oceanobacter mangrovi TaxID=2862510 RepID=UPI001C8E48A0|nr:TRZ/ATZ family hydrolase [Oceanobacter mangrovi]
MTADLRLNARWLLTMADATATVQENVAVFISNGRIDSIEPQDSTRLAAATIELGQHVLMPGYVNAHGHAAMSLFRGMADDLALMTWLQEHIWPAEGRWVGPEFVYAGTRLAVAEMLKAGTTTFADMYFFPHDAIQASVEAGIRHVSFTPILDFPTNFAANADEYIKKALKLDDKFGKQPLVTLGLGPHAPYTVSDGPLRQIRVIADEKRMPVQIHLHETAFEVEESLQKYGKRPTRRLQELGFLNAQTSCVHMTQIDDSDVEILQHSGASVVHCPESNLKLASGFCPTAKLLAAGVNLGLGTDGAASNNDLNLQGEMKTAAMLAKAVAADAAAVPAAQALYMATHGSARALGIASQTGSIEAGKWADLQAIDMSVLPQQPLFDVISQLVYTDSSRSTSHVWVAGKLLLDQGQLTTIDEDQMIAQAQQWATRIKQG